MGANEEKTEQPSEVKLKDARLKGQVAKSMDLVVLASFVASSSFLFIYFREGAEKISAYLARCLSFHRSDFIEQIRQGFDLWFILSAPLLLVATCGAILGSVGQVGFLLASHPLKPDFERIDPLKGLKKILSKERLFELIKQVVKFSAVLFIIASSIRAELFSLSQLARVSLEQALTVLGTLIFLIGVKVLLALLVLAIADYFWQRFSFKKSLRMSKGELKKEHKQQEGDPVLKHERKRLWQEALEAISPHQVKDGTVVIVNPTHLAVTLFYDETALKAPTIIAKGADLKAKEIIREAKLHQVPIMRNVALARALWLLDINEEIPDELFAAVAEILTFIYELSAAKKNHFDG